MRNCLGFHKIIIFLNSILTSGSVDGDIRVWKEIGDDDPTSQCAGETANCCIQYTDSNDKQKLIATSENHVQAFSFPNFERDGVEFRFSSAVTALRVAKKVRLSKIIE
jgi:chromosome transmission fidelity protein 4